ncbi:MAG: hypothetical protein DCC49_04990 [Acidobacteria bacterium]|nr:MAG: hypothetical protein DCC49_04990 [Acidobacteriota bacterium]
MTTPSQADIAFERGRRRIGWAVFSALAVLTVVEYLMAVNLSKVLLWMIPMAIAKAALIVIYFMHIRELWHAEEEI